MKGHAYIWQQFTLHFTSVDENEDRKLLNPKYKESPSPNSLFFSTSRPENLSKVKLVTLDNKLKAQVNSSKVMLICKCQTFIIEPGQIATEGDVTIPAFYENV